MKVSKLVELLKTENQDAKVFAYLGAEQGFKIVELGRGDAIIGKGMTEDDRSFVLIPIEVPREFEPWADGSSLDGTLCRNGYPIDECKCC